MKCRSKSTSSMFIDKNLDTAQKPSKAMHRCAARSKSVSASPSPSRRSSVDKHLDTAPSTAMSEPSMSSFKHAHRGRSKSVSFERDVNEPVVYRWIVMMHRFGPIDLTVSNLTTTCGSSVRYPYTISFNHHLLFFAFLNDSL